MRKMWYPRRFFDLVSIPAWGQEQQLPSRLLLLNTPHVCYKVRGKLIERPSGSHDRKKNPVHSCYVSPKVPPGPLHPGPIYIRFILPSSNRLELFHYFCLILYNKRTAGASYQPLVALPLNKSSSLFYRLVYYLIHPFYFLALCYALLFE